MTGRAINGGMSCESSFASGVAFNFVESIIRMTVPSSMLLLLLTGSLLSLTAVAPAEAKEPPPAHRGFQLSHQLGFAFPSGKATGAPGDSLGQRYNFHWHLLTVGMGAKVTKSWYVGGFAGFSLGAKGRDARVRAACRDSDANLENDIGCSTASMRVGLETRYSLFPDRLPNLWFGYGVGPVLAFQSIQDRVIGREETTYVTGWEYARLSTGLSLRPTRVFGVGPYFMTAIGQYNSTSTQINDEEVFDGKIEDRAVHLWFHVGAQMVLFP